MEEQSTRRKLLQWHPAFFAGIQIELAEDAENLTFENEHQLSTKPMAIDTLIIKKKQDIPIRKNIGTIFRKYNIIEYKDPEDYLSIDDFYKVYGYTCFYKSDGISANAIKIEELTISFVCNIYPRKLISHLQKDRHYQVIQREDGIYDIIGDSIPIQIIITDKLSTKDNLWLSSLTNHLADSSTTEKLLEDYRKHKNNALYQSMMDIIVRANVEKFKEAKDMCDALLELMQDELAEKKAEGERIGKEIGKEIGVKVGQNRVNALNLLLSKAGRTDDLIKAASDITYQNKLFKEFGL